jgi:Flp pilus assembly protein TadD
VLVYEALGEAELTDQYRDRVQGYRERNPYYHYAVATRAYEQREFDTALTSVRRALRLKSDEHEFYTLRGQALTALGRGRDAQQSFERAREFEALESARSQARVRFEGFDDP